MTAAASPAVAGVDPTGAFTFEEQSIELRLNPSGPTFSCGFARYSGSATGSSTMAMTISFASCTWPIACSSPSGSITIAPQSATQALTTITVNSAACKVSLPGCVVTLGAFTASGTQVEGTPGSLSVTVAGNTDAIPFTSTGFACASASIPSSGTMRFSGVGGANMVFDQTAGTDMSWT
jgi:hypothetical protein